MNFSWLYRIIASVLLLGAASTGAANLDDAFLKARDAARSGDSKQLEQLAAKFQGHLLEPYVQYWRLRMRLEAREPGEIRAWLAANRDTPLSDYLRRDWLKQLGKTGSGNCSMPSCRRWSTMTWK